MRVRFTIPALVNLGQTQSWISRDRPNAARRVGERIRRSARQLADSPFIGRAGNRPGARELVVRGRPYLLIYRVDEASGTVLILNVVHGAQDRGPERS